MFSAPVSLRSAAWQVKKLAHGKASEKLIHPPDKPAGALFVLYPLLAAKLAHLPGKLAGGIYRTDLCIRLRALPWAGISGPFRAKPFRMPPN